MNNKTIIKMFKYKSLIKFNCDKYITVDTLDHIVKLWERQISTDLDPAGVYSDDVIEYEITEYNDIIILNVF